MNIIAIATVFSTFAIAWTAVAQIETAPPLPLDRPQTMRSMEAVCTGIGQDAREDPQWAAYPLKVELVGRAGQYLGEAEVTLTKGGEAVISVRCAGPWVLFKLEPGAYSVTAEIEGATKTARVNVSGKGQARLIIRFPDQGGATSPEYVPKKS
jgi:hypothetical protein